MAVIRTDPGSMAEMLSKAVAAELEEAIKKRLQAQADLIVAEAARDLARGLEAYIRTNHSHIAERPEVYLVIDKKREKVEAPLFRRGDNYVE